MLKASNLRETFDGTPLFSGVSFVVNEGDRIGLVGANGCGKTSLLRILAGVADPAEGAVAVDRSSRVGYLPQEPPDPRRSLRELLEPVLGWEFDHQLNAARNALGIDYLKEETPLGKLSGGEAARALLLSVVLSQPTILLLDEPTNHLDIEGLQWLESFTASYAGAVVVVSHDRRFLDNTVTRIFELSPSGLEVFEGGYSAYKEEEDRRRERLGGLLEAQSKRKRRLEADITATRQHARRGEAGSKSGMGVDQRRRYAKKVARKALSRQRRLEREMNSESWIESPRELPAFKVKLPAERGKSKLIARVDGVPLLDRAKLVDLTVHSGDRVAVTGPNGAGKTTLLKLIAGDLELTAGRVEATENRVFIPQTPLALPLKKEVLGFFQDATSLPEPEARTLLGHYRFETHEVKRPLGTLSPGERTRLLLAVAVARQPELLLLDEPTNHLDFDTLDVVEEALRAYSGALVVASHDRALLEKLECTETLRL